MFGSVEPISPARSLPGPACLIFDGGGSCLGNYAAALTAAFRAFDADPGASFAYPFAHSYSRSFPLSGLQPLQP